MMFGVFCIQVFGLVCTTFTLYFVLKDKQKLSKVNTRKFVTVMFKVLIFVTRRKVE